MLSRRRRRCLLLWTLVFTICSFTKGFVSINDPKAARRSWILQQSIQNEPNQKRRRERPDPRLVEDPLKDDASDYDQPVVTTLGGGPALIFAMARKMLVWDDQQQQQQLKQYPTTTTTPSKTTKTAFSKSSSSSTASAPRVLPRWHPHGGISDVNPSFRTKAPVMNNQGYAATIWRNVRKANKPSLWRHALRTYDRMVDQSKSEQGRRLRVRPTTIHHEGALLACAKLGLWKQALDIYQNNVQPTGNGNTVKEGEEDVLTDNMVYSLVKAGVRGCNKLRRDETLSIEEKRAPLDAVADILRDIEEHYSLPLVARYLNPLAAAYQSLGLYDESAWLIQGMLSERTIGPEADVGEDDTFNVFDVDSKDKGSYSLLVQGAVAQQDWANAVNALRNMTDAGLYPNMRHVHRWSEASQPRTKKNPRQKREDYWLDTLR